MAAISVITFRDIPGDVFDPQLVRSFLTVVQCGSFSAAAQQLGVRQSTVSGHIARLEREAGAVLLLRDTHRMELTSDGTAMVGFGQAILTAHENARRYFADSALSGTLHLGAAEDLVARGLPRILRDFRARHPRVDLQLTVGLSRTIHDRLRRGDLDLAFVMRKPGETHGEPVHRDRLVWAGPPDAADRDPAEPVPLVAYPPPSITRSCAYAALDAAGIPLRPACTANSRAGLRAAVLAGLGYIVHPRSLLPDELAPVGDRLGLPDPGEVEFVLIHRHSVPNPAEQALSEAIRHSLPRLDGEGEFVG
ncbi:LysR family transcriptional regulator [Nocardia farcinica]|uniref:LysR family transcriptional regulator n=1 Tax=Nocardia farcinica TaxID=37329 RepID=UPI000321AC9F|nr:LysR family transcriptional regulator [Nocardia farcinica]MBF6279841.1 LysR family transcriptional regulator [Nocardia farcinica]MBF6303499.1 LysR family transcriptional regulator [Nocardia farcinica]MBF6388541.1 LysR family transcriptional regulator [Nocardia farcinica]MBF6418000.1 LysR family transcriptional regulator [Nocardia farcinica]